MLLVQKFDEEIMKAQVEWKGGMLLEGSNSEGMSTMFDSHHPAQKHGTPMEIMLQAMASCSMMDVISILEKKRKTIVALHVDVDSDRAQEHPKVFTAVRLHYTLISPDAELKDLERSVELSQQSYCSASAMFQQAGCAVSWTCEIKTN
jgi:putative redox protein